MKKQVLFFFTSVFFLCISCNSEVGEYDTRAVAKIDELTKTIGELSSLSYTVQSLELSKDSTEVFKFSDVYLKGPDKMFIETSGSKGTKNFWYNGEKFSYFLFNKKEYDTIKAPENTLKLIDSIHRNYNIHFPAADFLYPTLTDDLIRDYDQLLYFGEEQINDITCIAIEAVNKDMVVQIWLEKENHLPHRMVIKSIAEEFSYYEAEYSNWRANPKLPDILFEFHPPQGSVRKKLIEQR